MMIPIWVLVCVSVVVIVLWGTSLYMMYDAGYHIGTMRAIAKILEGLNEGLAEKGRK